jgi:hypothetical protein
LAQDLTANASSLQLTAAPSGQWSFDTPTTPGVLTVRPTKPEYAEITTTGLELQISDIEVNENVGTFELDLTETSQTGGGDYAPRTATWALPKFPYGFSVSDFAASEPEVDPGGEVTLTWVGSENATYHIRFGESGWVPASGRSFVSPQLYATTVFDLRASASDGGQTVTLDLPSVTVTVASPQVVQFFATPNDVGDQEEVTLSWSTINADGCAFTAGQSPPVFLPAASDPDDPSTLQPQYGVAYQLSAYKDTAEGRFQSPVTALDVSFEVVVVDGYTVGIHQDPTTGSYTASIHLTVDNAVGGSVDNAVMLFSDTPQWNGPGLHAQLMPDDANPSDDFFEVGDLWVKWLTFPAVPDPEVARCANVGLQFDYTFAGFMPVTRKGNLWMWRGQIDFSNGSS